MHYISDGEIESIETHTGVKWILCELILSMYAAETRATCLQNIQPHGIVTCIQSECAYV